MSDKPFESDNGFDRVDSRGMEGSTETGSLFPNLVDEEIEEIEIYVMPFWEALQLCVEEDEGIARIEWEDDHYVWVYGATHDFNAMLITFSPDGNYMPYTPIQDDMFANDWYIVR